MSIEWTNEITNERRKDWMNERMNETYIQQYTEYTVNVSGIYECSCMRDGSFSYYFMHLNRALTLNAYVMYSQSYIAPSSGENNQRISRSEALQIWHHQTTIEQNGLQGVE